MQPSHKIALAGAVWFSIVSVVGLPITIFVLSFIFKFRPDVSFLLKFSGLFFGLPAAFVGLVFANRIVYADSLMGLIRLGIFIVIGTNLLAALLFAIVAPQVVGIKEIVQFFLMVAAGYLIFDIQFFYGIPFIISAIASVVFCLAIQRTTWVD